jgi:hypothetical protein
MNGTDDCRQVAAALVIAIEAGLLRLQEAVRVLDREVVARSTTPAKWVVDASLARHPEDLLHALREGADDHAILSDSTAHLEAIGRAFASGTTALDVAAKVNRLYLNGEWPKDLSQALDDVYEESTCGHAHGGPKPVHLDQALRALFHANSGRCTWSALLDRVAQ